jgi:hypothetical protein
MLNQGARLRAFIEDLGLAFVDATAAVHGDQPIFEIIHGCPGFSGPPATLTS